MNEIEQFISDATRTESVIEQFVVNPSLLQSVLRMHIASGNMLDQIKKHVYYGKDYDTENLITHFTNVVASLDQLKGVIQDPDKGELPIHVDTRLTHAMIGAATESTELMEALRNNINGKGLDVTNVIEESGDLLWYLAVLHSASNQDMLQTMDTVIKKLKHRYPEKFTSENAINRDLKTEREILEEGISN